MRENLSWHLLSNCHMPATLVGACEKKRFPVQAYNIIWRRIINVIIKNYKKSLLGNA